jgi:hypothetical protein
MSGVNVYCGPLLKSLPCTSCNAERKMVWDIGPVNQWSSTGGTRTLGGTRRHPKIPVFVIYNLLFNTLFWM